MKKILKVISIILIIFLIIGACAFFAYRYFSRKAADLVIKNFVKDELNTMLDEGTLSVDDIYNSLSSMQGIPAPNKDTETESLENPSSSEENNGDLPQIEDEIAENDNETSVGNEKQNNGFSSDTKDTSASAEKNQAPMTKEEIIEQKANEVASFVDPADKDRMAQLIASKLSTSDISYLASLLSGGLTREEKRLAVKVALARYSKAEIKELQGYYHKYLGDDNLVS